MMQVQLYYPIIFAISAVLSFCYICEWHSHYNVYLTLMFIIIPIANLGYWVQAFAPGLEQALVGNKISYLGGCFNTLAVTLSILSLCKAKIRKRTRCMMFLWAFVVYGLAVTAEYNPYFYRSVSYEIRNGIGSLIKDYGWMHSLFYIMVIFCFLLSFWGIFHGLNNRKVASIKTIAILFVLMSISVVTFFFGRKIWWGVELLPASYVMAQVGFLIVAHKMVLYNVDEIVMEAELERGKIGVVAVDLNHCFLGCNEVARTCFPKFHELIIDGKVPKDDSICGELYRWMEEVDRTRQPVERTLETGDAVYRVTGDYLWEAGRNRGYRFVFQDDTDEQRYIHLLGGYNAELEREVTQKTQYLVEMHDRLVLGMANMVENRDNSTGGHIKRTSQGVKILIDEMRNDPELALTCEFCDAIVKAAPMHDLGKIAVDDDVLKKPGRFTPEEYELMKTHAEKGANIVRQLLNGLGDPYFARIAENVAHYHHERVDGSGYPCGLVGEQIPFEARVMAIADVYDALVSKRCYKEKMSFEEADRIIREGMGTQFDETLGKYYIRCRAKLEEYYSSLEDAE